MDKQRVSTLNTDNKKKGSERVWSHIIICQIYLSLELSVHAVSVYLLTVCAKDCSENTTYTVQSTQQQLVTFLF